MDVPLGNAWSLVLASIDTLDMESASPVTNAAVCSTVVSDSVMEEITIYICTLITPVFLINKES